MITPKPAISFMFGKIAKLSWPQRKHLRSGNASRTNCNRSVLSAAAVSLLISTHFHSAHLPRMYQSNFPKATAVSLMRLEKPHSLSYQESTRTRVPSMTLVWSRWNTDEWLSWLKSIDTLG